MVIQEDMQNLVATLQLNPPFTPTVSLNRNAAFRRHRFGPATTVCCRLKAAFRGKFMGRV